MTFLPETKKCRKCGKIKNKNEFGLNIKGKDGLRAQCTNCYESYHQEVTWENHLYHKFRIIEVDYELMLKSQNGVCAICNQPETRKLHNKIVRLSVDHDHSTGKIRGLLCSHCNSMLGQSKDNPEILRKAAKYLEEK